MSDAQATAEKIAKLVLTHRRNEVIEPDYRPGGDPGRTRVKCDGHSCDFYGVYQTWYKACEGHEAHVAEELAALIVEERSAVLREAAYHFGVIWGSGATTEERVGIVLSHWADHGVGARPRTFDEMHQPEPKKFDTFIHADARECLFVSGWSWSAFSGDEQSAMRVICDRTHLPHERLSR